MKKIFIFAITLMLLFTIQTNVVYADNSNNINVPYYTYTEDANGELILTVDAYTPYKQMTSFNGDRISQLEHVFVDEDDYIYLTDSRNRKVYILDNNYNYINEINYPEITFPNSTYVTNDEIYVVDFRSSNIYVFDKKELLINNNLEIVNVIGKPSSPIFQEGYQYKPQRIVVDSRKSIYVQSVESYNGIMMLNEEGQLMSFFGANPLRVPVVDKIRTFFLTEKQKNKMEKIMEDIPTDIAMDQKGFIYTVTQSLPSNPIKKFNVAGRNYLRRNMIGTTGMNSVWIGKHNNIISVDVNGVIYEYDQNGNLLFMFGGSDVGSVRTGLLVTPSSVATNSNDEIIVADKGGKFLQVYKPTIFANTVHQALENYQKGEYIKSMEEWELILQYNSMFDYAHKGLADAYLLSNDYKLAYQEYSFAKDYEGISNAFIGLRQQWLQKHLNKIFIVISIIAVLILAHYFLNKKYGYSKHIKEGVIVVRKKVPLIDELMFIFTFLRHPLDSYYEIKSQKRVSVTTSTVIYAMIFFLIVAYFAFTNQIFVPKTNKNILYEISIIVGAFALFMVSSYLVCSINDGEGSIKNVYNAFAYTLTPILVMLPIIILMSNALSYQEQVFYSFGLIFMFIWTLVLFFFMIKDIHNYDVGETFKVIILSLLTAILIGLFAYIVTSLFGQLGDLIKEMISEVFNR